MNVTVTFSENFEFLRVCEVTFLTRTLPASAEEKKQLLQIKDDLLVLGHRHGSSAGPQTRVSLVQLLGVSITCEMRAELS